jgi:hypothetical protein
MEAEDWKKVRQVDFDWAREDAEEAVRMSAESRRGQRAGVLIGPLLT